MTQREAAQPGDVLRAFTCTNFVFPTNSLFGAKPPVQLPPVHSGVFLSVFGVVTAFSAVRTVTLRYTSCHA